jgi:hypothetical protein
MLALRAEDEQANGAIRRHILNDRRGLRGRILSVRATGMIVNHDSANAGLHVFLNRCLSSVVTPLFGGVPYQLCLSG